MLKINKVQEPEFFRAYLIKNEITDWEGLHREPGLITLKNLNKYILDNEQTENGIKYCAYCEIKVTYDKSHIEHIIPRSESTENIFSYNNLVIYCNENNSCGRHKKNQWNEKFINPVTEDPTQFFSYKFDGSIISRGKNSDRSNFTIGVLNLNYSKLKDFRRKTYLQLRDYPKEYISSIDKYVKDFPSLIKYFKENQNN
jgi:uncharacterized protein (TIGR02646 family)